MEAFYAEFEAHSTPTDVHRHAGAEIIYVMSGELVVNLAGEDTTLSEGDSMYFDSGHDHSYRRQSRAGCSAIVVVTPQGR